MGWKDKYLNTHKKVVQKLQRQKGREGVKTQVTRGNSYFQEDDYKYCNQQWDFITETCHYWKSLEIQYSSH